MEGSIILHCASEYVRVAVVVYSLQTEERAKQGIKQRRGFKVESQ